MVLRTRLYKGLVSKVARELGVSLSVASRVAKGLKRSRRIERALIVECKRIEREIERAAKKWESEEDAA